MTSINTSASTSTSISFNNSTLGAKEMKNEDVIYMMVDFALPNNANQQADPKAFNKVADKQDKLMNFCKANNFQLVPLPEQLVIVYKHGAEKQMPTALITAMHVMNELGLGVEFIAAVEKVVAGKVKLSATASIKSILIKGGSFDATQYDSSSHANVEHVYAHEFANWFMSFVAYQMTKLSAEQKVELLSIFNTSLEVYEDKVSFDIKKDNGNGVYASFGTRIVSARNERKAIAKVSINHKAVSVDTVLVAMMQLIGTNGFDGRVTNLMLNSLPNMWEREPNYGVDLESDDPTRLIMDNTTLPINFAISNEEGNSLSIWPWCLPVNVKFDITILSSYLATGKAMVVDKYAKQFVGGELAANAGLLGRLIADGKDEFLTLHDADKEAKFFNRLTQARKHLKADIVGRSKSIFRVALPDGTEAAQSGIKLRTILSNSRLAAGSGPAFVNPALTMDVAVKKTKTFRVSYDRLSSTVKAALEGGKGKAVGIETLQNKLSAKITEAIVSAKVYNHGDNIVSLNNGSVVFLANTDLNQSYRITNLVRMQNTTPTTNVTPGYIADSFVVTVEVELSIKDNWFKLRNDGFKLTTLPYAVEYLAGDSIESAIPYNQEWDILLNIETQKGKLCQIITYILANGGGVYHPNTGILVMDNGTTIDLKEKDSIVHQWVVANTKTIFIQFEMAQAEYDLVMQYSDINDDVMLVSSHDGYVVVREKVQALLPDSGVVYQHYEVEISTPRENTGTCAMTPEQLAALALQNKELSEIIHEESRTARAGVSSLVRMATQTIGSANAPTIDLTSNTGRSTITTLIGNLDGKSDQQIVSKYNRAFPEGVVFTTTSTYTNRTKSLYLDFSVIAGMSVFIGGQAGDEISMEFVAFLNLLVNLPQTGVDGVLNSKLSLLKTRMEAWLMGAMESNGILKKAARSSKVCVTGKVRTMYNPILNHKDGELPKVALNPSCAIVSELGVAAGDLIAVGRVPMCMVTVCEVVLTTEVGIAHMGLLPHIWAACNEGE